MKKTFSYLFMIAISATCLLSLGACTSQRAQLLQDAQEFYEAGSWQDAIASAQSIMENYPESEEANEARQLLNRSQGELDLLDAASSYTEGNYTEAITQLSDIIGNSEDFEGTQCLKNSNNIIVDSVSAIYEQGDYETVISLVNELGSTYAENTLPVELDELKMQAEQAASFQPVVMQDYEGFPGVLDFGAFSGKEGETSELFYGAILYRDVDPWLCQVYVDQLKTMGFSDGNIPSTLVDQTYRIELKYDSNILRIDVNYLSNYINFAEIESGMSYSEVVNIMMSPGKLVMQTDLGGETYQWVSNNMDKPVFQIHFSNGVVSSKSLPGSSPAQTISRESPSIGMTAEEVRNSTWGKPEDINRTTTAYGVHEQWVYSNYRYIYFDNGIVTAIQE